MEQISQIDVMISREEIAEKVCELANRINRDYAGERVIFIGILKGSFMFLSDIVKEINLDCEVYFMEASSYGEGTVSTGTVEISKDVKRELAGENVIIIEDIIDTGITMDKIMKLLSEKGAKSVKLCACLSKPSRRKTAVKIDYLGFEIPDKFVVGYGLDVNEKYRNLPYIGIV